MAIYRMIATAAPAGAHSRYLSLIRRLERFERALERVRYGERRDARR